jgi:2-polyprenyl-3-methyl-5-hydroxy-6-metoxy-1,4-benzoquinol methylase
LNVETYQEHYAVQHGGGPGWFENALIASRRNQVLSALERHPHEDVLEIGCGLDPLIAHMRNTRSFTTVEPCESFVECARAAGAEVVQGFLEDVLPELEIRRPFDFVVASSLLHEVPDPSRFLDSVRTLCDPGTIVHFDVPNMRSMHRLLAVEMGLIPDVFEESETERRFQRTTRFDATRFRAALVCAGFEIVQFGTYFIKPFSHSQMEALIDSNIVSHDVIRGLEKLAAHLPDFGAEMFADVRVA